MRKLAKEITSWNNEECFKHSVMFATTSPELSSNFEHSEGMRYAQADVLESLGSKYNVNEWVDAAKLFRKSGRLVIELCRTAMKQDLGKCSEFITQIADIEEKAYCVLEDTAHCARSRREDQ